MRPFVLLLAPLIVLAALIIMFALNIDRDPNFIPSALINKPVPDFTLPPIDGVARPGFSSADLKGKIAVVNVFASWCIPCRDEHPLLVQLTTETDIVLYGLNQKDAPENARAFLDELGNPYDAIGADTKGRISIDWGVYGVPETFVVNAKGIITYKHVGPISPQSLKDSLLPAIEAARNG